MPGVDLGRLSCPVVWIRGRKFYFKFITVAILLLIALFCGSVAVSYVQQTCLEIIIYMLCISAYYIIFSALVCWILMRDNDLKISERHLFCLVVAFVASLAVVIVGVVSFRSCPIADGLFGITLTGCALGIVMISTVAMVWGFVLYCRSLKPGDEQSPVLKFLRCSCISDLTQRILLTLPFLVVALLAVFVALDSWHATGACSAPLQEYVVAAASVTFLEGCFAAWLFFGALTDRRLKLVLIVLVCVAGLTCGIVGAIFGRSVDCKTSLPRVFATSGALSTLLLVMNGVVSLLTLCCRTESMIDARLMEVLIEEGHPMPRKLHETRIPSMRRLSIRLQQEKSSRATSPREGPPLSPIRAVPVEVEGMAESEL